MIKPVREGAGLGSPPKEYHNNCPECINNVIKMKVDRKQSPLDDFCSKMKSLVQDQQNHLIRALTRRGEYRLHPAFREFEVNPSKWFALTEAARTSHVQRLRNSARKYMEKLKRESSDIATMSAPAHAQATECPHIMQIVKKHNHSRKYRSQYLGESCGTLS